MSVQSRALPQNLRKHLQKTIQCPLECLSTSSILNHDFLNEHTHAESEGIKPIDKIARHKQGKDAKKKKDASLGMEGINKIYYSKPFVFT